MIPELEHIAGQPFVLDTNVQDAAFFTDLSIQQPAVLPNHIDTVISFRFLAFGHLFTAWRYGASKQLPPEMIQQLIAAIEQQNFVYIDATELDKPYTGSHPGFHTTSWWYRFFDWL